MSAPEYRTPDETRVQLAHQACVRAVLDQAVRDGGSLYAAMELGEPAAVVERWVDRLWDGLREGLSEGSRCQGGILLEDRLTAIALLLEDRMRAEARAVRAEVDHLGGGAGE